MKDHNPAEIRQRVDAAANVSPEMTRNERGIIEQLQTVALLQAGFGRQDIEQVLGRSRSWTHWLVNSSASCARRPEHREVMERLSAALRES